MNARLLDVRNFSISISTPAYSSLIFQDFNLHIDSGEIVGLVGQSGSGKSLFALSLMRLLPQPPYAFSGDLHFRKQNLLVQDQRAMARVRGKEIALIFQEAASYWNPYRTIGAQISDPLRIHFPFLGQREIRTRVLDLLEELGFAFPKEISRLYPHELSGGMAQRAMWASALIAEPTLLLADEPTSAMDIISQRAGLNYLKERAWRTGLSILFVSHDANAVQDLADRVVSFDSKVGVGVGRERGLPGKGLPGQRV